MEPGLSFSEENYLKAIYALSKEEPASTNALAEYLDTKASSITDMLKKLSQKDLVNYVKYQGTTLTDSGRSTAVYIIRKHRLWEVFLVNNLGFGWDEVHDVAEQLEHIKSPKLINRLDEFLGYPTKDPHGDPIPDADGKMPEFKPVPLSDLEAGDKAVVTGVNDSSSDFLKFLDHKGIRLGDDIIIEEILSYDRSMVVKRNGEQLTLSEKICQNLLVTL